MGLGFGLGTVDKINNTYIYALIDPRDNSPKYIGATSDINKRLRKHLGEKAGTKKTNWLRELFRLGLKPQAEEIDCVNKKDWEFWERHYISLYRSWGFPLTNGTMGGAGNSSMRTEETKSKIRVARALQINTRKDVPCSEETKARLRIVRKFQKNTNKGMKHTDTTKEKLRLANNKPIIQYDLNLNFIKEWDSIKSAEKELKLNHLFYVVSGKRRSKNFIFKYKNK